MPLSCCNAAAILFRRVGTTPVPVAQLDKASDYESEDWGFKSLQGYETSLHGLMDKAHPS